MSVARNAGLNFFSQALAAVLPIATSVATARVLGPADLGTYGYMTYLTALGITLATLGLPSAATRFTALRAAQGTANQEQDVALALLTCTMLLSTAVFAGALVAAIADVVPRGTRSIDLVLAGLAVPLGAASVMLAALLAGKERFRDLLLTSLVMAPVSFFATLSALVAGGGSLTGLLVAALGISAAQLALTAFFARSQLQLVGRPRLRAERREVWRYVGSVSLIVLLDAVVWQRSEVLFLQRYSSPAEVGYYILPFGLVTRVMGLVPGAITGVLLPRFSAQHAHEGVSRSTFARALLATLWVTLPVVFAGVVLAGPLISMLYGSAFRGAVPVLQILLVSSGAGAVAAVAAAAVYGGGRQSFILKVSAAVALLNVSLDVLLIPRYGAVGAAVANTSAQAVGVVAGISYTVVRGPLKVRWRAIVRVALMSCPAAAVACVWVLLPVPDALTVTAGALSGALVHLALVRFLPDELRDVRPRLTSAGRAVAGTARLRRG